MAARTGAGARRKGANAEIEVAKMLGSWWSLIEEAKFKRTPLSGGWGDADVRGGFKVAGDICTTAKHWPFTIEVKRRENWSFGAFAKGRRSPVWAWWRQCLDAAAEEDRVPLLWARKSGSPWLVLAPERLLVPILVRHGVVPDVRFLRLAPGVDYGDILPCCLLAPKFLSLPPLAFLSRAQRAQLRAPGRP